jgi:hypothetical protein
MVDAARITGPRVAHSYVITATGTGPLSVVLAWNDWPGFASAGAVLTNDLDLTVK